MTKSKSQLRAEAVERLNGLGKYVQASSIQWGLFGSGKDNMPPDKLRDELVSLLTDDEPPEGDVAAILRKAASYDGYYSGPDEALCRLTDSTTVYYALETLADMVERDYVRREYYYERVKELGAERDEWKAKAKRLSDVRASADDEITYGFQFFKYYKEPRSTMSGETLFDYNGDAVGWIVGLNEPTNGIEGETNGIPSDSPLDAKSRAEIEDVERSRAVSGDSGQDADVDSTEDAKAAQDTREKLEADVRVRFGDGLVRSIVMRLLDRQVSITERHWMEICGANASANIELKRQIDVLEANNAQLHTLIAELQDERDMYRESLAEFKAKWFKSDRAERLKGYVDKEIERCRKRCYSIIGPVMVDDVLHGEGEME